MYTVTAAADARLHDVDVAIARSLQVLEGHERALALALDELGSINLPEISAPSVAAAAALRPMGPFYLAYQLELAGLLHAAELIVGLYSSGSITAPLGDADRLLTAFWQQRNQRLAEVERKQLFASVFEPPYFDRLLSALMRNMAQATEPLQPDIWREASLLAQSVAQLVDFLIPRASGMASFAAEDTVNTINSALAFMRAPALLSAFGAHNVWDLVRYAQGGAQGEADASLGALQQHVDLGKSGQAVLLWVADHGSESPLRLDSTSPEAPGLADAARTWLAASGAVTLQ